jgi:adenylate cyclase class 2
MREIEIKAKLLGTIEDFTEKLKTMDIVLGSRLVQHDVVYGQPGAADNVLGANWLRIRTENDTKIYFTLKKSVVGHLDSIEHEVIVDNADELESIIKELGYELHSDLTKVRRKAKVAELEICVDDVEGLGRFVEVEKLCLPDADNKEVVDELWDFLSSLGVSKNEEVHEGYDVLERQKRGIK